MIPNDGKSLYKYKNFGGHKKAKLNEMSVILQKINHLTPVLN